MATTVDEILVKFLGDTSHFDRAVNRFGRGISRIGKMGMVGSAAGVAFFGGITAASLKAAASLEQTEVAFRTLTGSMEKANKLIKDMQNFARRTPFQVTEVEQGAKRLLAMGFAAKEIIPTLKAVGDITAGIGIEGGRFERIIHNLAQVRTQGVLTARELRDFAVNGVPLLDKLTETINRARDASNKITREDLRDMITRRQITDEHVIQAFTEMTSKGGQFFDLMFEQSKTFLGIWSNIQDSVTIVFREIGKTLLPTATRLSKVVLDFLETIQKLDPSVKQLIGRAAVLGTGLAALTFTLAALTSAFGFFIWTAQPAVALFNALSRSVLALTLSMGALLKMKVSLTRVLLFPLLAIKAAFVGLSALLSAVSLPMTILVGGVLAIGAALAYGASQTIDFSRHLQDAKAAAKSFALATVGFFWNIGENWAILVDWMNKSWVGFLVNIPNNMKIALEALIQLWGAWTMEAVNMFQVAGEHLATAVFNGFIKGSQIWNSEGFRSALSAFSSNFIKALLGGEVTELFSMNALEGALTPGDLIDKTKTIMERALDRMKGIEGPEFNLTIDGLTKELEEFKTAWEDLGDGSEEAVNKVEEALRRLRFLVGGRSEFHISQQGLGHGIVGFPGLASGGPARRGTPYVVGEKGPELFIPTTDGHVISNKNSKRFGGFLANGTLPIDSMASRTMSGGAMMSGALAMAKTLADKLIAQIKRNTGKEKSVGRSMLEFGDNLTAAILGGSSASASPPPTNPLFFERSGFRVGPTSEMPGFVPSLNVSPRSHPTSSRLRPMHRGRARGARFQSSRSNRLPFHSMLNHPLTGVDPLQIIRNLINTSSGVSSLATSLPSFKFGTRGGRPKPAADAFGDHDELNLAFNRLDFLRRKRTEGLRGRGRIHGRTTASGRIHGRETPFVHDRVRQREERKEFQRSGPREKVVTKEEKEITRRLDKLIEATKESGTVIESPVVDSLGIVS